MSTNVQWLQMDHSSRPSHRDPLIQTLSSRSLLFRPLIQATHSNLSSRPPLSQTPLSQFPHSDPSQSDPSFRPLSSRSLIQTLSSRPLIQSPLIQTPQGFSPHSSRPLIQSTLIQTPHSDPSVLFKRKTKYYNLLANDLRTSCSV